MPGSSSFVEARLYLDLDLGLVDTHINLTYPRVGEFVLRMHGFGAFGKVSRGRFIVALNRDGSDDNAYIFPLFRKDDGGEWRITDRMIAFHGLCRGEPGLTVPTSRYDFVVRVLEALQEPVAFHGENRGPAMGTE